MYNNPYNFYPYLNQTPIFQGANAGAAALRGARPSIFGALSRIKWGSILTNTQKTLNVINQAIPVYYQMKPIASNLKSFGKIMSALNEPTSKTSEPTLQKEEPVIKKEVQEGQPTFFID